MPNWKVWPAPPSTARFNLHVFVHELAGLRSEAARYLDGGGLMVQVEWRGNRQRAEAYLKRPRRSCTSRSPEIGDASTGAVCWNEGFSHACNLKELVNSGAGDGRSGKRGFRSWMVHIEIHGFDFQSSSSSVVLGRTKIDVAGFAREKGKTLRIPIKCNVAGVFLSTELIVTIELIDVNPRKGKGVLVFSTDQQPSDLEFSSDDDFGRLAGAKQRLPLLSRIFSQSFSFRSSYGSFRKTQPKPSGDSRVLLHRKFLDEDGEETAGKFNPDGRRLGRGGSLRVLLHQPAVFQAVVVGGVDSDESENDWENRTVVSRDGLLELTTEVFFASIDQCSEKADGGGACAVLVAVIADWLHRHKRRLPRREELDELIREGSSEWRKLCERDVNRERFSDQHFDLETVMAAEVRSIATPTTYVGFFSLDKMPDGLEHLSETAMSFDAIWDDIAGGGGGGDGREEKIYVTSWNDHFFILKVEKEAIFLVDTLGERLYEGCNQAYILKFGRRSAIFRREKVEEKESEEEEEDDDGGSSPEEEVAGGGGGTVRGEMVCEGIGTCKEFIKGFLAAVPLRELQNDIGRGLSGEIRVHRQLQIEFHHTVSTVQ